MKRTHLWAGLTATAVATTVVSGVLLLPKWDTKPGSLTATPDPSLDAVLRKGIKQGEAGDLAGAAKTFRKVLDLDAGNKLAWYNLGVIAQYDARTADALAAYDKALKADPKYTPALYNKAILLEPSDTDQAIAILRRVVVANPKAATAYLHLGQNLVKKNRDSEAEDAFVSAVRVDPSLRRLIPQPFRDSVRSGTTTTDSRPGG
ncbi:tetratricopeptide repeat protein [Streptomyces bullii]|uniref:Tetratricopeptide repeat protein n=1 Tax=Streptomyces bullii TaxID=349910 RepID=A0ABW0V220_9ACTN